jgi:hypothetical protein
MTNTEQKLMYANVMLEQAKLNSNDYSLFIANLDAFITDARSVTFIMQEEFDSITGFKEWYGAKQTEMKNDPDFEFFNKLRVDTTHVRPFNTPSRYTTSFPNGLTISGGKEVSIPLGRVDERGNLVNDRETPVSIDGKPATNIKRSTTSNYFFKDRPNEDAVKLCETYFRKVQQIVTECHENFRIQ